MKKFLSKMRYKKFVESFLLVKKISKLRMRYKKFGKNIFSQFHGLPKVNSQGPKTFLGNVTFFRRGHFMPKINITFFIANWMINIFMFNNFYEKSVFSEETAKYYSERSPVYR